tara:strand:+ start:104 stop:880 length:777 start_codon:yes stop_codon:yes gene_type:complete
MALTKVGKEGITGISNSSDATAITIDSSEHVGIGTTSPSTYTAFVSGSTSPGLVVAGTQAALILVDTDISGNDGTLGITKGGEDTIINNLGNGSIKFFVNGSERAAFLADGGLTFNGDSGQVNALDDYEEGTFTPRFQQGLTSAGYSTQVGTYIKIGRQVVASVQLRANSGTENGDHIYIGGLPFVFTNDVDLVFGAFFTYNGGFWTSDANTQWLGRRNETNLAFYKQSNGGAIQGTTSGVATNLNADVRLVAVYRTD